MKPIMMILHYVTTLGPNAPCVSQSLMNLKRRQYGDTRPLTVPGYWATNNSGQE